MDVKQLRFCESIARLGSFTRAAEELHIAQPALSIAIGKLESELGVPLFFRHPRGVSTTPEGDIVIARASRIFQEMDSIRRELDDASELKTGIVRIGLPPIFGLHYTPKLVTTFNAQHPGIQIAAIQGSATRVGAMIDDGSIDLGIVEERRIDPAWVSQRIGQDEMVLALSAQHRLAARSTVDPNDLAGLPMVVLTPDFLQRQLLDAYCAEKEVEYKKVMECNFIQMTVLAAREGIGAVTLLRSFVASEPGLVALSFRPKMPFAFDFCWRRDRYLGKAAQALVRFARPSKASTKTTG